MGEGLTARDLDLIEIALDAAISACGQSPEMRALADEYRDARARVIALQEAYADER